MPRTHPPYSPEFRRQMVELVRAGRDPDDLAREFEPTGQSIRSWVAQAARNEGRREELIPGWAAAERDDFEPGHGFSQGVAVRFRSPPCRIAEMPSPRKRRERNAQLLV